MPPKIASEGDAQDCAELKKLYAAVGQCKASFTRFEDYIDVNKTKITPRIINIMKKRLIALEGVWAKYKDLSLEINVLCNKTEEEDFKDELEDRYYAIYENIHSLCPNDVDNNENKEAKHKAANKLPNIDIPVFTGEEITKYVPFIELLTAVVGDDAALAPVQKLYYLRSHLKKEALGIIEGLPLTDSSYEEALQLLKQRYDNPCILITSYVNCLLDFPAIQKGTAHSLNEFVSHVRQQIGALKNMKQPVESWDMLLLPILLRKLDQYSARAYHMERDKSTLPTVAEFTNYLEKRASSFDESQRLESSFGKKSSKPVSLVAVKEKAMCRQASIIASNTVSNHCAMQEDLRPIMERFWEIENVDASNPTMTTDEELCEMDFKKNVQLKDAADGHLRSEIIELSCDALSSGAGGALPR